MKKFLGVLLTFIMSTCVVFSQRYDAPNNLLTVRCGGNTSTATSYGVPSSHLGGFWLGLTDHISIYHKQPVYLETGLIFVQKGYKISGYKDSKTKLNYFELPVMVNYRVGKYGYFEVVPTVGGYVSVGASGKLTYEEDKKFDVFKEGSLDRLDCGLRLGTDIVFGIVSLSFMYDLGFKKIDNFDPIFGDNETLLGYKEIKNKSLLFGIGFNF